MKALGLFMLLLAAGTVRAGDPETLPFVGGMPGGLEKSVVVGGLAYCATTGGLLVLDVADPADIVQVSWLPQPGFSSGIAVQDGFAYLLVWGVGMVVIDIGDPAAPAVAGTCADLTRPGDLALSGRYAFVADMDLGFCVVDIQDPSAPAVVAGLLSGGEYFNIDLADGVVYVADDLGVLHLIDVTNPLAPKLIVSEMFPGEVRDVAVHGNLVYLACGTWGLRILDLEIPGNPVQIGQLRLEIGGSYFAWACGIAVADGFAFVTLGQGGLGVVDVSDPAAPAVVVYHESVSDAVAVEIRDDRAFVVERNGGLDVVDIGTPSLPVDLGRYWLLGLVTDVAAAEGKFWVAGGYSFPQEKSSRYVPHAGLFVVEGTQVIGYCSTGLQPEAVVLSGHRAYLPSDYGGVRIQDIGDPAAPVEVGFISTPVENHEPAVAGNYVYTFGSGCFMVVDVNDPAQPVVTGECPAEFYGNLTVDGDVVYACCSRELCVFDVSAPAAPVLAATLDLPHELQESALCGDFLLVANGRDGLTVVDVANPVQPEIVTTYELPGNARSIACRDHFAYVAAASYQEEPGGIYVLDVSEPWAPVQVERNDAVGDLVAVAVDGQNVVVAAGWGGILVFRHDTVTATVLPQAPALLPNYPNPFNPRTTICYDLSAASSVTLTIFDLSGRRVRSLVNGAVAAGHHEVTWDGCDERSRAVSSGVYLYRLVAGRHRESRTMVLAR